MDARLLERAKFLKEELDRIKKEEMELRKEICAEILANKPAGTHTFIFGDFRVKAVRNITMSLDLDELTHQLQYMSEEEKDCIEYKPSLSKTKYKKLVETEALEACIISKDGAPSLTIVEIGEEG